MAAPDAKSQVSVVYEDGKPVAISNVVISTQHAADASHEEIEQFCIEEVIRKVLPAKMLTSETEFLINPTGRFVVGGPQGDTGLTGRKIIVDSYGGMGRHGGGAFSRQGSDQGGPQRRLHGPLGRQERGGREAGRASARCSSPTPSATRIRSACTSTRSAPATVSDEKIIRAINKVFSFQPADIIEQLKLRRPIYSKTTNYGHFGKNDADLTWEATDKVTALLKAI